MKRKFIVALVAFGLLVPAIMWQQFAQGKETKGGDVIVAMEADYPVYSDLGMLVGASDLIARGIVEDVLPSERFIPESAPLDQLPAWKAHNVGFLVTKVQVRIESVLKGDQGLIGKSILVDELGGIEGKQIYMMKDQPLSEEGQDTLFFLEKVNDSYSIVGGQQGRFLVAGAKLDSISKTSHNLPVVSLMHGSHLDEIIQRVREIEERSRIGTKEN